MLSKIKYIIIHHSASIDDAHLQTDDIKLWHTRDNGWRDIGYNYVIEDIEGIVCVLKGRSLLIDGAHSIGYNDKSIGVCCVGDFNKNAPSEKIYVELASFVKELMQIFGVAKENVIPHKFINMTKCPGELFDWKYFLTKI